MESTTCVRMLTRPKSWFGPPEYRKRACHCVINILMAAWYGGASNSLPIRQYYYCSNDKICTIEHSICSSCTYEERYDSQYQEAPPNNRTHFFTKNTIDVSILKIMILVKMVYLFKPPEMRPDDMRSNNRRKGATFIKL